ncbi:hypothetical protein Tco_1118325 [Tanacetum coccineum]
MSTYLKNMVGYKHNELKNKSFDDIQKLFDKAMKSVNTFVDMDTELVEGSEVIVEGSEQKVDEDKETSKLQRLIEVVLDKKEVAIDVIPLATKPPSIESDIQEKDQKESQKQSNPSTEWKGQIKAKTVNGEVQLQALVDGKKVIITESSKLTFYKAFFSPQWKFLIHTILQCLSAKTTAWNEFSSTMASTIICLATNQKFNFSKYIIESMVKNLENVSSKFLMYPRFVQVFLEKQLEGMSNHKRIYVTPSHTKKIFRNMRRVGKGFSGRETPLFSTMMVQAQEEMGEGLANPTDPHHIPTIIQPSTSQHQKKQKPRKPKRKDTEPSGPTDNVVDEAVYEEMDDSLKRAATTATSLDA